MRHSILINLSAPCEIHLRALFVLASYNFFLFAFLTFCFSKFSNLQPCILVGLLKPFWSGHRFNCENAASPPPPPTPNPTPKQITICSYNRLSLPVIIWVLWLRSIYKFSCFLQKSLYFCHLLANRIR